MRRAYKEWAIDSEIYGMEFLHSSKDLSFKISNVNTYIYQSVAKGVADKAVKFWQRIE